MASRATSPALLLCAASAVLPAACDSQAPSCAAYKSFLPRLILRCLVSEGLGSS